MVYMFGRVKGLYESAGVHVNASYFFHISKIVIFFTIFLHITIFCRLVLGKVDNIKILEA